MIHYYRDIAVFCDSSDKGKNAIHHAARIAQRFSAHLIGIYGTTRPVSRASDGFVRGSRAISHVLIRRRKEEEQKILEAGHEFADTTRQYSISSEFRIVWHDTINDDNVARTLHSDMIVSPAGWSAEHLLLTNGIPVLIIPDDWKDREIGTRILVGWNRSREARRAISDAMAFMHSATKTTLLTVTNNKNENIFEEAPGLNMSEHLQRHDISVTLENIVSQGQSINDEILNHAHDIDANLLVIGAYSRPRTSEILFGGTTRSLLSQAQIPMLISR